jgi:hypothetical protein
VDLDPGLPVVSVSDLDQDPDSGPDPKFSSYFLLAEECLYDQIRRTMFLKKF